MIRAESTDPTRAPAPAGRKCPLSDDFFDPHALEHALAELAARQYGVLAIRQLSELGLTRRAAADRCAAGRLHRIHHGVYALVPASLLSRQGRDLAAVLACSTPAHQSAALSHQSAALSHQSAALSHQSAAMNLDLRLYSGRRVHVTVPSTNGRARKGIVIHRSSTLRAQDIVVANGIRTTSHARTLLDLAGCIAPDQLNKLLARAFEADSTDMQALHEQIHHNARRPEAGRLAGALARYAEAPDLNELERRFDAIIRAAGLPEPERQAWLDLEDGGPLIRPDFLWRSAKLIVETDGFTTHGTRQAFESDRHRDQRAAARGYRTLRITRNQVRDDSRRLQETLAAVVCSSISPAAA